MEAWPVAYKSLCLEQQWKGERAWGMHSWWVRGFTWNLLASLRNDWVSQVCFLGPHHHKTKMSATPKSLSLWMVCADRNFRSDFPGIEGNKTWYNCWWRKSMNFPKTRFWKTPLMGTFFHCCQGGFGVHSKTWLVTPARVFTWPCLPERKSRLHVPQNFAWRKGMNYNCINNSWEN